MKHLIEELNNKIQGKVIYLSKYGSHLYGLDTENSDTDYRGVFIPSRKSVLLRQDIDEYNSEGDIEVKLFSIYKFLELCSKGDTNALDLLFSITSSIEKYGTIQEIYDNRDRLINTSNMETYTGYAISQAVKYGIKGLRLGSLNKLISVLEKIDKHDQDGCLVIEDIKEELTEVVDNKYLYFTEKETQKNKLQRFLYVCGTLQQLDLPIYQLLRRAITMRDKYSARTISSLDGSDWKALSHALRSLYQLQELYTTGTVQFPLKDKEYLLSIKLGKVSREEVDAEIARMIEVIQSIGDPLQWKKDELYWEEYILQALGEQ